VVGVCVNRISTDRLFERETNIETYSGPYGPHRFLEAGDDIRAALEWQAKHKDIIFLRDMLDCSIPLDYNLASAGQTLKSKKQSYVWLSLAILGPFGFIIPTMLRDNTQNPGDLYQHFVGKLEIYLRVAYELCFFVVVWVVAYQTIVLKRDLMIMYESIATGTPTEKIINLQLASSGMWAAGEGLEEVYLAVLFYLLWPICFNAVGHLAKLRASSKKA
jgi:hypothetical protein